MQAGMSVWMVIDTAGKEGVATICGA
jgi:hypothetical protein